jgi:hypothetical protein
MSEAKLAPWARAVGIENALFFKDIPNDYDASKPETRKHKGIEKQKDYYSAARNGRSHRKCQPHRRNGRHTIFIG